MSSQTSISGGDEFGRDFRVASVLTPSFRANIPHFGENVMALEASRTHAPLQPAKEIEKIGYVSMTGHCAEADLKYKRDAVEGASGFHVTNGLSLDEDYVQEMLDDVELRTDPGTDEDGQPIPPDLVIRTMTIEFESERVQDVAGTQCDSFVARFVSDEADDERKPETAAVDRDIGLYKHGGNYRNLNLYEVYEPTPLDGETDKNKLFEWGGPSDTEPLSNDDICAIVYEDILPREYSDLKLYTVRAGEEATCIGGKR